MARTGSPATRHVAAVERAVAVLDALAGAGELGTNEVARRTGLNASTASRQLATLVAAGLVAHVAETGRYRLGPRLVELGNAALAGLDVRAIARPHLRALAAATGETATLSVPGDPDAITVDFVQSAASVQSVARLGRPSVAHATAAGKVVLAFGEVSLPPGPLRRFTGATITDLADLAAEIAAVRRQKLRTGARGARGGPQRRRRPGVGRPRRAPGRARRAGPGSAVRGTGDRARPAGAPRPRCCRLRRARGRPRPSIRGGVGSPHGSGRGPHVRRSRHGRPGRAARGGGRPDGGAPRRCCARARR